MSIETFVPLDLAFLKETGMSVPSGHRAMVNFLGSDAFLARLTKALVEVEEANLNPDCLTDSCDHEECPDPPGIGCGDAARIRDELLKP